MDLASLLVARLGKAVAAPFSDSAVLRPLPQLEDEATNTSGRLYTWGRNDYGRCGLGDTKHREVPTRVPDLCGVVKVRGGAGHTLAVTANGDAMAFGKNYLGQLGVGDDEDRYFPHKLQLEEKAISCSGGGNFSAVVTEGGNVYAMGCSYFHATGQPTEAHLHVPTLVPLGAGIRIVDVACGELHAVSLSADGICFAWGRNTEGEASRFCPAPVRVKGLEGKRVVAVSSCFNWNMIIAEEEGEEGGETESHVWAWGENVSGQLGLPTDQPCGTLAARIHNIDSRKVTSISCGKDHGAAVAAAGDVWTWGVGELGQLGIGEGCGLGGVRAPQRIPYFHERRAELTVVAVAAAKKHTLFLTRDGQVYVSGDDQFGNDRLDEPVNPRYEPHQLDLPFRVVAIGVGGYHSCIVTPLVSVD